MPNDPPTADLLTISVFAGACGLTASALRFYADSGLLPPATVDQTSGYRYYTPDQVGRAVLVRRLRAADMPLDRIAEVLAADGPTAARIVDDHVDGLARRFGQARAAASAVKSALGLTPRPSTRVRGLVFTVAVEQVLTATTHEPGLPVLNAVHIEVSGADVVLTATDRYRLSTRTLVASQPGTADWAATVHADDLRLVMPWSRRQRELRVSVQAGTVRFDGDGDGTGVRECRVLAGQFPDHRMLLASLPAVRTRLLVSRNALAESLENVDGDRVRLDVSGSSVRVRPGPVIPAVVTGPAVGIEFAVTTLYPAISSAVGPDVLVDIAEPGLPVVVRSADSGDLTTLAMPLPITEKAVAE